MRLRSPLRVCDVVIALGAHPSAGINRIRFDGRQRIVATLSAWLTQAPARCMQLLTQP
jgi:hypothetical protein